MKKIEIEDIIQKKKTKKGCHIFLMRNNSNQSKVKQDF